MNVPDDLEDRLEELSSEQLDEVARLAERLAEGKRREQRIQEKEEGETATDIKGDSLPEGVPAKATLTTKTINDNDYYYWQWRGEDGKVKSKYKAPVGNE